jgi:hypothetical protein
MKVRFSEEIERFTERYDYLAGITREGWAWEHLRRHPEFIREAYNQQDAVSRIDACRSIQLLKLRRPVPQAGKWGLIYYPHPDQRAVNADVFWSADQFPRQVEIMVTPRAEGEVDEIFEETVRVCRVKHLIDATGGEHLRIQGKCCSIQVRCHGLSLMQCDLVRMDFKISGFRDFEEKIRIMKAARAVYGDHTDAPIPFTTEGERRRNGLMALDARQAGLSLSEIARLIFGETRVREEWGRDGRWMKDRVRGYIASATRIMEGGYRKLLKSRGV